MKGKRNRKRQLKEWKRMEIKREVEDKEVQWRGKRDGKGKER